MRRFQITYATWRTLAVANGWATYHVWHDGTAGSHSGVKIYTGHSRYLFAADVDGPDEADWLSTFPASAICPARADAAALVIGAPVEVGQVALAPNLVTGLTSISPLSIPETAIDLDQSWQVKVAPQTTGITDIHVAGELVGPLGINYLQGGSFTVRTTATEGSVLDLKVVDRDDAASPGLFGALGIPLTRLDVTGLSGDLSTADYAVGQTSGARSRVLSYVGSSVSIEFASGFSGGYPVPWQDGEPVKIFDTSDVEVAAGTSVDWVEGGVLELSAPVKDEWIETGDKRDISPGGAKIVPAGLYYRVVCHNSAQVGGPDLRVKVSLSMATE